MTKDKLEKALRHLEMMNTRDEIEEDDDILELKGKGVNVTEEEAPAYRYNMKALFVEMPYTEKIKQDLIKSKSQVADLYRDTAKVMTKGNKQILRIPQNVELSQISSRINEELCDDADVCDADLDDNEWEKLQETKQWKAQEHHTVRKLIADQLYDDFMNLDDDEE